MAKKTARLIADLDERTRSWARAGAVSELEVHAQEVRNAFPEMVIRLAISAAPPAPAPMTVAPETMGAYRAAVPGKKRRVMPPEARKRIARKMRARWRERKANGKNRL